MRDSQDGPYIKLRQRLETAWAAGQRVRAEDLLDGMSPTDRAAILPRLLAAEMEIRRGLGDHIRYDELADRFPDNIQLVRNMLGGPPTSDSSEPMMDDPSLDSIQQLGRYRITGRLGTGTFGVVFSAFDEELRRQVAIKVPRKHWVLEPSDIQIYLDEARVLASLDHPNIVPVFDFGRTDDGRPFVVTKFIDGSNLAVSLAQNQATLTEAISIIASIADALHFAHRQSLVHRDVKPANILVDKSGKAYLTDFGMVLRDDTFGRGPTFAGTPAYMSPEQARSEGHRVDGRSDVFSLGVVLYEMLTGRRPFRQQVTAELLDEIIQTDARPLRQIDDSIPHEIERICLKALSKEASQRYTTAKDLADDLRSFAEVDADWRASAVATASKDAASTVEPSPSPPKVVPRGLRSFDASDADFFLDLLPGPRDRHGIPEALRFWQQRCLESDADRTFSVGLLYGPSGCGKSSLVKAGLLPRLPQRIKSIYLESSPDQTEARLLARLQKLFGAGPNAKKGLIETIAGLRRGHGLSQGEKVLIVLDQFEQWLHAKSGEENSELMRALRQCDGGRVQCLLLVRGDFWMAISHFLRQLEIPIREGENASAVDLFDLRHARKVLRIIGQAYGSLPQTDLRDEHEQFLQMAVEGLSQDGKLIPVRLALFSEMIKGRAWTPATLKSIGGIEGIGTAFLEESFSSSTSPPRYRIHEKATRAVLQALLPDHETNLKGTRRSYADLIQAAGYEQRIDDFEDLLQILCRELRLVSPSDPEGDDLASSQRRSTPSDCQFYQLTHDYLVPALREWLTRKQRQTWRGRAELRLAERTAQWDHRHDARSLPSLFEWLNIRILTRSRDWTPAQRVVMRRARQRHGLVLAVACAAALFLALGAMQFLDYRSAHALRDRIESSSLEALPKAIAELPPVRRWADPILFDALADARERKEPGKELRLRLALLPAHSDQVGDLSTRLLDGEPDEVAVIRVALADYMPDLSERYWRIIDDERENPDRRLRAASALAAHSANDARWSRHAAFLAARLAIEKPRSLTYWTGAFDPIGANLLPPLLTHLEGDKLDDNQRRSVALLYQAFAQQRPAAMADLQHRFADDMSEPRLRETVAAKEKRRANLGAALVVMGQGDSVWPRLVHSKNPTLRSQLIERLGPGGVSLAELEQRLDREQDTSTRRALILAMRGANRDALAPPDEQRLIASLLNLFENDKDCGIHSAAEWLLREWGFADRLGPIEAKLATNRIEGGRKWFLNTQGQTFAVIDAPAEVTVGEGNARRVATIGRRYAIATKEVTVEEFRRFRPQHERREPGSPSIFCPASGISWIQAVGYCNELTRREFAESETCYTLNPTGAADQKTTPKEDWQSRKGYRLAAEAEWEFACRAGSLTRWSCGDADDMLIGKYAVFSQNSNPHGVPQLFTVGSKKPNDFGLFDMHGNVSEWCNDPPIKTAQNLLPGLPEPNQPRIVRGGAYGYPITNLTSQGHEALPARFPGRSLGLRLVRTLP